jgi:hypothetical protein
MGTLKEFRIKKSERRILETIDYWQEGRQQRDLSAVFILHSEICILHSLPPAIEGTMEMVSLSFTGVASFRM